MSVVVASTVLFLASVQTAPPPPVVVGMPSGPFEDGPLEGLSLGTVSDPAGNEFFGLIPSKAGISPANEAQAAAIAVLLQFRSDLKRPELARFLTDDPVILTCKQRNAPCEQAAVIEFGEPCQPNTPYRMADGRIRIEWLYGNALYYTSTIAFEGDKISSVMTQPAWVPSTFAVSGETE